MVGVVVLNVGALEELVGLGLGFGDGEALGIFKVWAEGFKEIDAAGEGFDCVFEFVLFELKLSEGAVGAGFSGEVSDAIG